MIIAMQKAFDNNTSDICDIVSVNYQDTTYADLADTESDRGLGQSNFFNKLKLFWSRWKNILQAVNIFPHLDLK